MLVMEEENDIYGQYWILGYTVSATLAGPDWWESLSVDSWHVVVESTLVYRQLTHISEIQFPPLGHESGSNHPTVSVDHACKTSFGNH